MVRIQNANQWVKLNFLHMSMDQRIDQGSIIHEGVDQKFNQRSIIHEDSTISLNLRKYVGDIINLEGRIKISKGNIL